MKILITGICGFVGSTLARELLNYHTGLQVFGLDNLSRPGSELNRQELKKYGVTLYHGDIRNPSDLELLPSVHWVIDAAANPSVLAGVSGITSSRQLMEHNLIGSVNVLEYCKKSSAGLVMLSTSRIYSLSTLAKLPFDVKKQAFVPRSCQISEPGVTEEGITESFSTTPPLSLYGSAKLASELLALEYGMAFQIPIHINRCGVLAGAGQFGKPDQGIFSYWIHSYCQRRPLRYVGFGGTGYQVRDCLHPKDLAPLLLRQMHSSVDKIGKPINVGGGVQNSLSLAQLTEWCVETFGPHPIQRDPQERVFDVPWLVLSTAAAKELWDWHPATPLDDILSEIASHARGNPHWLDWSSEI